MKKVFQGEIFSVWQWEQKLYDGTTKTFEKISRTDAGSVIGVLPDKRILLIWDEQPHREGYLTPACGKMEEGETPKMTAAREFREETGYEAEKLIPFYTHSPYNKLEFTIHCFIGKNARKIHDQALEAGEKIEPRFFTFDEFLALGQDESLRAPQLRIMLLEAQIDPQKKEDLYNRLYG